MALDPVCKSNLKEVQVKATYTYKGETYQFCCESCRDHFSNDPKKHIGRNWWQRFLYRLAESNAEEFEGNKPTCH